MTGIRAVVFDLDGTLIDSVPDIAAALNICLADAGRPALTDGGVAELVGGGARELVARALGRAATSKDVERTLADFLRHYEAAPVTRTRLYPGARALLDHLAARGIPRALCTNKPAALTRLILDQLGLAGDFQVVWAGEADKPLKPDAACLRSVCADLLVVPAATVMVGDSRADILAAGAAGCRSILLTHGYERADPASLGADRIVPDLAALRPALEDLGFAHLGAASC